MPALRQEYGADLVVANVENATHGKGISPEHWQFLKSAGVDVATSGNHVFLREAVLEIWKNKAEPLVRPANYLMGTPGTGAAVWEQAGQKVLVINLIGQVFMKDEVEKLKEQLANIL